MILILADEAKGGAGERLYGILRSMRMRTEYLPLADVRVEPCVNCGVCTKKTPGRCAARDDGDAIYPRIAGADAVVVVTPVVFGGYSFRTKRVVDKFGIFMDSRYYIKNGELVKGGLVGRQFRYFVLGIGDVDADEAAVFESIVRETIAITRGAGRARTCAAPDDEMLRTFAEEVLGA